MIGTRHYVECVEPHGALAGPPICSRACPWPPRHDSKPGSLVPRSTMLLSAGLFSQGGATGLLLPSLRYLQQRRRPPGLSSSTASEYQPPRPRVTAVDQSHHIAFSHDTNSPAPHPHICMKQQRLCWHRHIQPARFPYNHHRPCCGLLVTAIQDEEAKRKLPACVGTHAEAAGLPAALVTSTATNSLFLPPPQHQKPR